MNRNQFLKTLGAFAGSTVLSKPVFADFSGLEKQLNQQTNDDTFWKLVRDQFLFPGDYTYLNTGGIGAIPLLVLNKVKATMDKVEIYPRPGHDQEQWLEMKEKCSYLLGRGCRKEELAFTSTATEGINIVINGLDLKEGDEVITSTHEHPALHIPLLNQALTRKVLVKTFHPDLESGLGNVQIIRDLITKKTRLIFISHVTCTTGQVFPLKEIAQMAKSKDIIFAVDGAQAAGQISLQLKEWGVDCYVFSGHKWVLGPRRTGVLYVCEDRMEMIRPTTVGAYSDNGYDVEKRDLSFHPTAQRYEYGTQNEALFYGLGTGADFIQTIGIEKTEEHNRKLAEQFYKGLKNIPVIQVLSPEEEQYRSAIISFRSSEHDHTGLAAYLSEKRIRVRVVPEAGLDGIRVSFHIYNNEKDVDRILNEIIAFINSN
ncbi:MAG: aminotransferase class V-fold PLP-dependent enzyme [Bacteroidales bacterium]|nr:MAG: aminotransferase class V-fold PLP-dependent enzyme [Bacteroidales bacterium]